MIIYDKNKIEGDLLDSAGCKRVENASFANVEKSSYRIQLNTFKTKYFSAFY